MQPEVRGHIFGMVSPTVIYKRMQIEYGWFGKTTKTKTNTVTAKYDNFLNDREIMDANHYVHYIEDQPMLQFAKWKVNRKSML